MSVYQKYYDLSSDDNDADSLDTSSSSSSEEEAGHDNDNTSDNHRDNALWSRSILHIDIDCFYVQCEEIDRGMRDGNREELDRPLAIGQKHIVVTCNYVARSRGVTKLMSKTDAMRICPDLRIVDGSDLRRYRTHSRSVYEAFRVAVQKEVGSILNTFSGNGESRGARARRQEQQQQISDIEQFLPCKRNAMDEMMADVSTAVDKLVVVASEKGEENMLGLLSLLSQRNNDILLQTTTQQHVSKIYIFGDDSASSAFRIVEDQTGASSNIFFGGGTSCSKHNSGAGRNDRSIAPTRRNVHEDHNTNSTSTNSNRNSGCVHSRRKVLCRQRMEVAVRLARLICESIFRRTGFHVSAGISVSPMLAKLSVIEKPKTVNVLLPWRSPDLIYFMPLRKTHEIGSRTYRALSQAVFSVTSDRTKTSSVPNITVRDFLQVPREKIIDALLAMLQREKDGHLSSNSATDRSSCEQKCDLILERCRGLDSAVVADDGGGVPQTVSVENSFRRGTVTTKAAVQDALAELCRRLPPLIQDRVAWSRNPSLAYPTTIRLTVRAMRKVDPEQRAIPKRRNPYSITKSKQANIGMQRGKVLLLTSNRNNMTPIVEEETRAVRTLRDAVNPLLQQLVFRNEETYSDGNGNGSCSSPSSINITRMNLAVSNFQDVIGRDSPYQSPYMNRIGSQIIQNRGHGEPSPIDGDDYNSLSQRQWNFETTDSGIQANTCFEGSQTKKRKDPFATTPTPVSSIKWEKSPRSTASKEQSKSSRKFSRTRIDQFFAQKQP
jgi:nucleotidyltransferase/DNA polymerase involved in DNA repair